MPLIEVDVVRFGVTRYLFLVTGIAGALFLALASDAAHAEKHVALIIGNSAYRTVARLPNPEKDAASMAKLFKDAGFDTVVAENNVGNLDFKRAIRKFEDAAGDSDIAVVFYAGHGIEIGGVNYLIPVDAKLANDHDAQDEAITIDRLIDSVEGAKRLRLIILDACRDDPFVAAMKRNRRTAARSISSGLGRVEPASADTLIAYAAKAGSTAEDGDGEHSPFTTALLANLATPGLDIRLAFGRVRDQVMKMTNRRQEPFVYGSLGGAMVALVPTKDAERTAESATNEQANLEITFWNSIKTEKNPRLFEAYLRRYPNGEFADIARITLDGMKTAALTPPVERPDDKAPISDPGLLEEVRERLYELNFDPGPSEGPYTDATRKAIREFEQQSNLAPTGTATQGLLRSLREIGGLKPWGAIVYGKDDAKWGMSWGEDTRKAAVERAHVSCGDDKRCPVEISFFGTECGVFAHSESSWAITARNDIRKAKEAALADCRKRGKGCQIVASVCADGAERFSAAK
jgi:hypothetical protein